MSCDELCLPWHMQIFNGFASEQEAKDGASHSLAHDSAQNAVPIPMMRSQVVDHPDDSVIELAAADPNAVVEDLSANHAVYRSGSKRHSSTRVFPFEADVSL